MSTPEPSGPQDPPQSWWQRLGPGKQFLIVAGIGAVIVGWMLSIVSNGSGSTTASNQGAPIANGSQASTVAEWWSDCAGHWTHDVCNPVPASTIDFCNQLLPADIPPVESTTVTWPTGSPWPQTDPSVITYNDGGGLQYSCSQRSTTDDGGYWDWTVMFEFPSANHPLNIPDPCTAPYMGTCMPLADGHMVVTSTTSRASISFGNQNVKATVSLGRPIDLTRQSSATVEIFNRLAPLIGLPAFPSAPTSPTTQSSVSATPSTAPMTQDSSVAAEASTRSAADAKKCDQAVQTALQKVVSGELSVAQAARTYLIPNGLPESALQPSVDGYHEYVSEGFGSTDALSEAGGAIAYLCYH